jgi:short-subunit dehydrogenase
VLVNKTGIEELGLLAETLEQDVTVMIKVDLMGPMRLTRLVLPGTIR